MPVVRVEGVTTLLEVFDMLESIAFYRDALGFEVVRSSHPGNEFTWALLALDGAQLMLNTAYDEGERPPERPRQRVEAHADTALFFACLDLDAAYQHLRAKGFPVLEPAITTYGMRQLGSRIRTASGSACNVRRHHPFDPSADRT